ncbi:MAG: L-threonylcarbamoyladenylate synthase [Muribaculaceae bacterium]|nr:L-threonylcarbamoyladenylate synthase [Muribaculaceae bacterium]MCM1400311.1 L-threonylcarbamoyladenylate synthase [Clostridium sp.]MCM1461010.1 L-threonylcarbamoyladenylate synthase [Bacteroides sp.]
MDDSLEKINTVVADGSSREAILQAADILRSGGLVAFPTETVYGLGADALSKKAAEKIYAAKGRPSDNPLIVHIADVRAVHELADCVPPKAEMLMEAFWPGPLTIILPKKTLVPDETTGGLGTVALRMPSHPAALEMIRESGLYIAAPSANTSGRPSPTVVAHVLDDLNGKVDMILDGGAVGIGIESTIVDLTETCPTILRPGFITKQMLEQIIGEVKMDAALEINSNIRPKAPGMKYTHYAPKGELTIVEALNADDFGMNVARKINALVREKQQSDCEVAVIATLEHAHLYECEHVLVVGDGTKGETIAAKLYGTLRKCDELSVDYIFSEAFNTGELGSAIMNRLLKAAGQRVIKI